MRVVRQEVVEKFRDAGAELDMRNQHGETALHHAVRHQSRGAVRALVQLGANVHTRTVNGRSLIDVVDEEMTPVYPGNRGTCPLAGVPRLVDFDGLSEELNPIARMRNQELPIVSHGR